MSVRALHSFPGDSETRTVDDDTNAFVTWPTVWFQCKNACVWIEIKCLEEKETRHGHWQKLYTDTYERLVLLSVEHLANNVCGSVKYLAGEELESRPDGNVLKLLQTL